MFVTLIGKFHIKKTHYPHDTLILHHEPCYEPYYHIQNIQKKSGQAPLDVKLLSNNHVLVIFPGFTTPGIRESLKGKRQAMPRQRKDTPLGRIFFRPWLWPKGR